MYTPDAFGTTEPRLMWGIFNAIARTWKLTPQEQQNLLTATAMRNGSPPPESEEIRTRIELIKDIEHNLKLFPAMHPPLDHAEWMHRAMPCFNWLSPLQVASMMPVELRQQSFCRTRMPEDTTHGLELVRQLAARGSVRAEPMGN